MTIQVLVIGPAGSGKSTVGREVASRLGVQYIDGDQLHPKANLEKMSKGTPLSDDDRDGWVANILAELRKGDVVIGASLLKFQYREQINRQIQRIWFAQLDAPRHVLEARLDDPTGALFRKPLLGSQLRIFDPLTKQEPGRVFDATQPVEVLVAQIVREIRTELAEGN
jgi:carbohydrate kinase (thermoresistant glucokinase family)